MPNQDAGGIAPTHANPFRAELVMLVAQLGYTFSCAHDELGEVHEIDTDSVEVAIKQLKGDENTIVVYPDMDGFLTLGNCVEEEEGEEAKAAYRRFRQLVDEHKPTYANAGDPALYDPESTTELGGFFYCFLFKGKGSDGKNLLVLFETAQA